MVGARLQLHILRRILFQEISSIASEAAAATFSFSLFESCNCCSAAPHIEIDLFSRDEVSLFLLPLPNLAVHVHFLNLFLDI